MVSHLISVHFLIFCVSFNTLMEKGRSFSTMKVYLAAILVCHVGFEVSTVGSIL